MTSAALCRGARIVVGFLLLAGSAFAAAPGFAQPVDTRPGSVFRDCPDCPEMVIVPPGSFEMGAAERSEETPVHAVRIPRAFAMSRVEVTWEDWESCVRAQRCPLTDDHGWGRGKRPVIKVSWNDATAFAAFLAEKTGKRYRLPSEAEWEYAARAGSKTAYWWGDEPGSNRANCRTCETSFDKRSAPVASFPANPFGLYDLNGNVWEWTQDCWVANYEGAPVDGAARVDSGCDKRVVRGGSWYYIAKIMTSHYRSNFPAQSPSYNIGIRLVRDLP